MPLPGATNARAVWFSAASIAIPLVSCQRRAHFYPATAAKRTRTGVLLPLNGPGRLRRDVVRHTVHTGNLVDDPRGDALEHLVRQAGPVGGHRVFGGHRAQHDRVGVRAVVAHHADGLDGGQHREALPDLSVETGPPDLLDDDGVGVLQDLDSFARDRADDAHRETRTRERLAPDELLGKTEL